MLSRLLPVTGRSVGACKRMISTSPVRLYEGGARPHIDEQHDSRSSRPASETTLYKNEFVHVSNTKDFPKERPLPAVDDTNKLCDTRGDPYMFRGWSNYEYLHYDLIKEPTFPRKPDVAKGELAAGANLIRTDVWHTEGEPAIKSIARFNPDNFRPLGYETAPVPDECTPEGLLDFRDYRLPVGHADRRPFVYFVFAVGGMGAIATVRNIVVMVLQTWWLPRDESAAGIVEVDLKPIFPGQNFVMKWTGKPVFIRRRTEEMIEAAKKDDEIVNALRDPQMDRDRVQRDEWLVTIGVCTHLGCIPYPDQGIYGGYFCPCHGSHYDHSGRIRMGPAPLNMEVPPYEFIDDFTLRIGS